MGFSGQVIIVADSVASMMSYDALCRNAKYDGRYGSETSINDPESVQNLSSRNNPLISISDGGSIDDSQDVPPESKPRQNSQARIYRKSHSHPQESEPPQFENVQ
ncbi:uncharacterized protein [Parasteatoda tepidariorum]|nr:uncharacterized protein LOC122273445 [Parasteatoda tepidariorum]